MSAYFSLSLVLAVPSVHFHPHNRKQVSHTATGSGDAQAEGKSGTSEFQRCVAAEAKQLLRATLGQKSCQVKQL